MAEQVESAYALVPVNPVTALERQLLQPKQAAQDQEAVDLRVHRLDVAAEQEDRPVVKRDQRIMTVSALPTRTDINQAASAAK